MKTIAIATLLGIVLSTPALASTTDCAQRMKSSTSKAANSYVYINRIASPVSGTALTLPEPAAQKLASQL